MTDRTRQEQPVITDPVNAGCVNELAGQFISNCRIRTSLAGFGMSGQIFRTPFIYADRRFELK